MPLLEAPEAVREFTARLPNPCPVTVIEDAGHMPFYEKAGSFAEAAGEFLRRV